MQAAEHRRTSEMQALPFLYLARAFTSRLASVLSLYFSAALTCTQECPIASQAIEMIICICVFSGR